MDKREEVHFKSADVTKASFFDGNFLRMRKYVTSPNFIHFRGQGHDMHTWRLPLVI